MTLEFKDPKACPCQSKHRRMAHVTNRTDGSTDVAITCVVCGDTVILGVEPEEPDVGGVAVSENQSSTPCLVFESRRHIPDDLFDVLLRMGAEEVYAGARGINEDILKRIVDHVDSSEVSLSYTSASEVGHGAGGQGMSEDDTAEDVELCIGDETVESEDGIRLPWPPDLTGLPEDARAGPRRRPPTPPASELFWATTRMCRRLKQEMWTGDENPRFDEVDMAEIRENVHRILPPEEEGPQVYANLLMRAMFHHGDYEWSVSEADRFLHDAVRAMGLTPEEELPYKVRLPNDMWVVTVSEDGGPLHSGTEIPDGFVPVAWVTGKWDPGRAHSLRYIMYETLQGATGAHVDLIEEGDA